MILSNRLLVVFTALMLSASAHGDTFAYTYTGNDFTQTIVETPPLFGSLPPYTTSDSVTGFFTLSSALAANLDDVFITPASFFFSDGVETYPLALTSGFFVSTDASGSIDKWYISLFSRARSTPINLSTAYGEGQPTEDIGMYNTDNSGSNMNDPGTWAESINGVPVTSAVPEPPALLLLGAGMLGMVSVVRRRFV